MSGEIGFKLLGLESEFGYKIDALPLNNKGKDKLIENLVRLFSVLGFALTFVVLSSSGNLIYFFPCLLFFFLAGINNFKYFQNKRNLKIYFW